MPYPNMCNDYQELSVNNEQDKSVNFGNKGMVVT
jgi:hypothetical protein